MPFGDLEALREALDGDVAAVITEPIQGIAGIVEPPDGWLRQVAELVHENGSLLIADEVQSGLGRTGAWLASLGMGVRADIVTVGKGLGNGFPVAACLVSEAVAQTVKPGEHGTTFGGAPMACAAVEATLDIIVDEGLIEKARVVGETLAGALGQLPGVVEVRGSGAWIGVVLDRPAGAVKDALLARGFLVGTASDPHVLRLAPPAVMPPWVCCELAETLGEVLVQAAMVAA